MRRSGRQWLPRQGRERAGEEREEEGRGEGAGVLAPEHLGEGAEWPAGGSREAAQGGMTPRKGAIGRRIK